MERKLQRGEWLDNMPDPDILDEFNRLLREKFERLLDEFLDALRRRKRPEPPRIQE